MIDYRHGAPIERAGVVTVRPPTAAPPADRPPRERTSAPQTRHVQGNTVERWTLLLCAGVAAGWVIQRLVPNEVDPITVYWPALATRAFARPARQVTMVVSRPSEAGSPWERGLASRDRLSGLATQLARRFRSGEDGVASFRTSDGRTGTRRRSA
jgi:hypothetical protein